MLSLLKDIFLNLDTNLMLVVQNYGILAYPLMFIIIFLETGLVITPFLPGDSLIFAAGALAGIGILNVFLLLFLLALAAILGDTLNYWIGRTLGKRIISKKYEKYLIKTEKFYEKHGGKTIILARFIPIIRTFAPFTAGIGKMNYPKFLSYNITGGILWTAGFTALGYYFGQLPFVKNNFSWVIIGIIIVSLSPIIIEYFRERISTKKTHNQ